MPKIFRAKRPRLDSRRLDGQSSGARIALSGAVVRTKSDKGYLAEMAFVTKAMSLGFNVCKPMGETPGFDFTVESGLEVKKVQIKSRWGKGRRSYPAKISSENRAYRPDETDFVIVYVVPEDSWYVLPVDVAARSRIGHFYPHNPNSGGRLEIYREAWHLLGRPLRGSRKAKPVRNSGSHREDETWL